MKNLFFVSMIGLLLAACSTPKPSARVNTPVAQIQVAQSTPTDQAMASDVPSPTIIPSTATLTAGTSTSTTSTATVTGTSTPGPLQVLSSQGYTMEEGFYIVGEVQNNTDTPMGSIAITATLYSKQTGKLATVGTENGTTLLNVIPAKGKAPFLLGPYIMAQRVVMYEFQVQGQASNLARQDLAVQSDNSYQAGDWLHIRGQVDNPSTTDAQYVKAIITLYDPSGNVVGAASTYTLPPSISAGGSAPFEIATEHFPNFDRYVIQIQAQ